MFDKQEKNLIQSTEKQTLIQLIVFLAGTEEFGVPIDAVREIIKISQITPIPTAPDFIKGIINVRGEIVTTIDVKLRFSLPTIKEIQAKHIIVTKQEEGLFGLIVDEVIEVLRIDKNDIKPAPSLVGKIHKKFISGVVTHGDRLIILLDLNEVLSHKELIQFSQPKNKLPTEKIGQADKINGNRKVSMASIDKLDSAMLKINSKDYKRRNKK